MKHAIRIYNKMSKSALKSRCILVCPVCAKKDWEYLQRIRRKWICNCNHCGLLATADFLTGVNTTERLYETSSTHHSEYEKVYAPYRSRMYERVLPHLERFRQTNRILELGCSYGHFLEAARLAAWDAEGVEVSKYACEAARSRGFSVHYGEPKGSSLVSSNYDVIVMWDVIEHLTDPSGVIDRCAELLRPGGAFVARTPDGHALAREGGLARLAYRQLVYPSNPQEHVFHFTPEDLTRLLKRKGFHEFDIDKYGGWEERIISGRNLFVRAGRHAIMRYALHRRWPYEFSITAVKGG